MSTEVVSQTDDELTYKLHLNDDPNTVVEQSIKKEELPNPATEILQKTMALNLLLMMQV